MGYYTGYANLNFCQVVTIGFYIHLSWTQCSLSMLRPCNSNPAFYAAKCRPSYEFAYIIA